MRADMRTNIITEKCWEQGPTPEPWSNGWWGNGFNCFFIH